MFERGNQPLIRDTLQALKLLVKLIGDEIAGLADKGCQTVAGWFVESHSLLDFLPDDANTGLFADLTAKLV